MNKILIGINSILGIAVIALCIKVYSNPNEQEKQTDEKSSPKPTQMQANKPTGKIVFVNIDRLNEESLEIKDLVKESTQRRKTIESSLSSLSALYQKKVEEYQTSAKAGIAPASEMQNKEKELMGLQKEAESKQMQMDNLSIDLNDKNNAFQKTVREFLNRWNSARYDYIISYSETVPTMLLGNASLEITTEVIEKLNDEYKKKKLK